MAQNRISRGGHGDVTWNKKPNGRWEARTNVRDVDGRRRTVRATGDTKGAASRELEKKLDERSGGGASKSSVTPTTTFEELGAFWLSYRKDHGKVRKKGPLAPQTLATYASEINHVIIPAIGQVRLKEVDVPFLDRLYADVEHGRKHGAYEARPAGRSSAQLRVVVGGMLQLAVAHGAIPFNPARDASPSAQAVDKEVEFLTVEQALHLRHRVRREVMRVPGQRMPNHDLEELVDLILGTGCREGEALAIRPVDLLDVDTDEPKVWICGTIIEPRKGYVAKLFRQDATKTREDRILYLPDPVVRLLKARMDRQPPAHPEAPIFAANTGNWISPSNMRTKLRTALARAVATGTKADRELFGTSLHTLRRTVGTHVAHTVSLDAARDQLGHRDPSITYRHYVGKRPIAPDLREVLNELLAPAIGLD